MSQETKRSDSSTTDSTTAQCEQPHCQLDRVPAVMSCYHHSQAVNALAGQLLAGFCTDCDQTLQQQISDALSSQFSAHRASAPALQIPKPTLLTNEAT